MPFGKNKKNFFKQSRMRKKGKQMNRPAECICPECNIIINNETLVPCFQNKCPHCGKAMARRFSID